MWKQDTDLAMTSKKLTFVQLITTSKNFFRSHIDKICMFVWLGVCVKYVGADISLSAEFIGVRTLHREA